MVRNSSIPPNCWFSLLTSQIVFLGLAQICVGSNSIQRPEKITASQTTSVDSEDSDDSTSDTFDDATSPDFLKKKLEFMFRIYDLDR